MKIYRKVHPYERKNPERESEDVVKQFKNHAQAISVFCAFVMISIFLVVFFYMLTIPYVDLSLVIIIPVTGLIGLAIKKPVYYVLSKLFNDPAKGVLFMSFILIAPLIFTFLLLINSLITFDSANEKFRINDYVRQVHRGKHSSHTDFKLFLENDKFYFQPGFRTVSNTPSGTYITYRFRRGILGLRVLEGRDYSDQP